MDSWWPERRNSPSWGVLLGRLGVTFSTNSHNTEGSITARVRVDGRRKKKGGRTDTLKLGAEGVEKPRGVLHFGKKYEMGKGGRRGSYLSYERSVKPGGRQK